MFNLTGLKDWYLKNVNKLVLLFMIVVMVSVTFIYIPYLNIIITPGVKMFIISLCAYILFSFSTRALVVVSMYAIFFSFILTFIELDFIAETLGNFLYLLLVSIFVDYVRSLIKNKTDL